MARALRRGTVLCTDLIAHCISVATRANAACNMIAVERFEAAMDEARQADRVLRRVERSMSGAAAASSGGSESSSNAASSASTSAHALYKAQAQAHQAHSSAATSPSPPLSSSSSSSLSVHPPGELWGVPFSVKENFAVAGLPQTAGVVGRKGKVAEVDATAVARLRAAGAIPIATTNVSELCMWLESSNKVYGRTRNPYSLDRIAGGSSGGEAVMVACGATPFGVGSDVGGSLRMPAAYLGIFSHKPSPGLVPNTGQYPTATRGDLLVTGPLCRKAEDLMPLLKIMAGPDGTDPACRVCPPLRDPSSVHLRNVRVVDVIASSAQPFASSPVDPELAKLKDEVIHYLGWRCGNLRRMELPLLRQGFFIWSACMTENVGRGGAPSFRSLMEIRSSWDMFTKLASYAVGRSPHTLPALGLAFVEPMAALAPGRNAELVKKRDELKEQIEAALGDNGVLIHLAYPTLAPRHVSPIIEPQNAAYTAVFNALGLPVTQVPCGLSKSGLPMGVQVVSTPGNDHVCIAIAQVLESRFGGWVPPPTFA